MLDITSHYRNRNENHFIPTKMTLIKKKTKTGFCENVQKLEP